MLHEKKWKKKGNWRNLIEMREREFFLPMEKSPYDRCNYICRKALHVTLFTNYYYYYYYYYYNYYWLLIILFVDTIFIIFYYYIAYFLFWMLQCCSRAKSVFQNGCFFLKTTRSDAAGQKKTGQQKWRRRYVRQIRDIRNAY